MIYRPFSKTGLVTLPKEARDFLSLGADGGTITIDQLGRFQAKVTGPNSKQDELLPRRRVTDKGQFTIPTTILRAWGVTGKGEVSFHIQEPYLIVSLAGPETSCKLCESTGNLLGHPCIICDGSGKMRLHPMGALGELAMVTMKSRKYGIAFHTQGNDSGIPDVHIVSKSDLPAAYLKLVEVYFKQRLHTNMASDKLYRHIETGREVLASEVGKAFYIEAWTEQKAAGSIPENSSDYEKPHELPINEYIDQGVYVLSQNDEYELVDGE
ncbi:hypothetical protein [Paenibacillus taichungensis]